MVAPFPLTNRILTDSADRSRHLFFSLQLPMGQPLDKMGSDVTTSLVQVSANRQVLEKWLDKPAAAFDGNVPLPDIREVPALEWGIKNPKKRDLELKYRRILLTVNQYIREDADLLKTIRSNRDLRQEISSDGMKILDLADRFCVLELQKRGLELPRSQDFDKINQELALIMPPERIGRIAREAFDVAERIMEQGSAPEKISSDTVMIWLAKIRGAKGAVGLWVAGSRAKLNPSDVDNFARKELKWLLELHISVEGMLAQVQRDISEMNWRCRFLVVEVWINWVLGLLYGGALILGTFSFFAKKSQVAWKGRILGVLAVLIGAVVVTYCYIDHPPSAGEPGIITLWVAAYGGFWVGTTATLLMVLFPRLVKVIQRRTLGKQPM